ncbi:uncharacterized protein F21D5.5 isoform X2 [Condylostylus longicornis]|uniref:uncharacterized protein F21D5.5 isoform X2 n=1 Tax=Condylostylus longicornis TaxID=2530218 RepID=UPI00244E2CB7|nr:uncharacterized protein F21D5.5 isoform X2 [Condylostylus longicornis]
MPVNGANASGLNGFMIENGKNVKAVHGDIIEVLYGKYNYKIDFEPPPDTSKSKDSSIKDTLNSEAISNFWECIDNNDLVVYTSSYSVPSEKVAGYDLDWTIVKTKSGNVFPKDTNDWEIMLPEIPKKLKLLVQDGFKICIFTNQSGIGKGNFPLEDFKKKIEAVQNRLNIPLQVFIATGRGIFRKPLPGMWNYLQDHKNGGVEISKERSFYVGDAAGRPETKLPVKRKRDHSCVDRLFAFNIGVSFFTPEEHFQGKKKFEWVAPEYNPKTKIDSSNLYEPKTTQVPSENCEIIIMVGLPGSGKSTFSNEYLEPAGYKIINADILGNVQKCLYECEESIKLKKSCAIDNTNIDLESRKKFINLARKYDVDCRCFIMNTSFAHIKHNLVFRVLTDKDHSKINEMILNAMKKKFVEPSLTEGFKEIVKVNIVDGIIKDPEQQNLYNMYLTEK